MVAKAIISRTANVKPKGTSFTIGLTIFFPSGSKSFIQEAYRECERFWAQVRGVPNALWRADNAIGACEGSFEERGVSFFEGRDDHGKQERARADIPLVQSKHERVQRVSERGAEVFAQCTLLQR